ncbi:MAG: zinc ribbon domain-containing protein [Ktedonobacteraceae bacterium]|nr:zinc ribbon domain-containing protein [Ktedonobacteraceae bacterium]MBO0791776.1 zinc ribbon domain-containing protein [Ktedonobacteraceae bacterium]
MPPLLPRNCPRCGAEVKPQQQNCFRCGLDLAAPQYPQPDHIIARKGTSERLGCALIVLALLLLLGGGVYGVYALGSLAQSPITTTSLHTSVTYASVSLTVLSVQQARNFADDPSPSQDGMLRVELQAQNKTADPVHLVYSDIAQLVLPGGKVQKPAYVRANGAIEPDATQTSMVDFSVPATVKPAQLVLRLGSTSQAQMDIPLVTGADLSKYEPKKTDLHNTLQFRGLDWSLTSATTQWSVNGQQASKGKRFVIFTLRVDNTLAQTSIPGSAYDYMRLKAGSATLSPIDTTMPVSFDAGATGKTGTVTFLVPQGLNQFTLIFHSQKPDGFDQATTDVQL